MDSPNAHRDRAVSWWCDFLTRGVLATAQAVYAPEQGMWVYSIRLSLLAEGMPGALSADERGFETCQLHSRHWVITDESGEADHVRGDGVVRLRVRGRRGHVFRLRGGARPVDPAGAARLPDAGGDDAALRRLHLPERGVRRSERPRARPREL